MRKSLIAIFCMLFALPALAQNYPSPTYKDLSIQGNLVLPSKAANTIMVAPNGTSGSPTFRSMLAGDMPFDQRKGGGALNLGTATSNGVVISTNNAPRLTIGSDGTVVPSTTNVYSLGNDTFKWANFFSQKARIGGGGWLEPLRPATESITKFQSISDEGIYGVLGASKSAANAVPGAMSAIGGGFYAINDNTTQIQSIFGVYAEGTRNVNTGSSGGIESAMINRGSNVVVSPYTPVATGQNGPYWASCGRPDVADSQPCSFAYGMLNAGPGQNSPFNTGILFSDKSVFEDGSGQAIAIDMPARYNLLWRQAANGNVAAGIRSDITGTANTGLMTFTNSGIRFESNIGNQVVTMASTGVTIVPPIFSNAINSTSITATGNVSATVGFKGPNVTSIVAGAAAGTGGSLGAACSSGHTCDQSSGKVAVNTGAAGQTTGVLVTITFANARGFAPNCVVNGSNNGHTAAISVLPNTSATTLDVIVPTAVAAGSIFQISYVCGGA